MDTGGCNIFSLVHQTLNVFSAITDHFDFLLKGKLVIHGLHKGHLQDRILFLREKGQKNRIPVFLAVSQSNFKVQSYAKNGIA